MLELTVAISIMLSLILYALMGGADFGGGMWDLLAAGPHAVRQKKAIANAIGPIWEATMSGSFWWWCCCSPGSRLVSPG